MMQDIYVLTQRDSVGNYQIAMNPDSNEIPISFSPEQAEYFLNFAESRRACAQGDEFILLKGAVDLSTITGSFELVQELRNKHDLAQWQVVARKTAEDPNSSCYRAKVINDLQTTRASIIKAKRAA